MFEGLKDFGLYRKAYKQDALVRNCINMIAYFTTHRDYKLSYSLLKKGSESRKNEYDEWLKILAQSLVDANLLQALNTGVINMKVFGVAVFYFIYKKSGVIIDFIPLEPEMIQIKQKKTWDLDYLDYNSPVSGLQTIKPTDILFLINTPITRDYQGLSEVAPLIEVVETRRALYIDLRESAKRTWAPLVYAEVDTSGVPINKEDAVLKRFSEQLKPGTSQVFNLPVKFNVVDLKPNVESIVRGLEKADEEILGAFGIPKALASREKTLTRATLDVSLRALYESQVEGIQQYLKREVDKQVLSKYAQQWGLEEEIVFHLDWNPITSTGFSEMATAVSKLVDSQVMTISDAKKMLGLE
jgi:hypothetical protein